MICASVLLVAFLQVAACKPLLGWDSGCIATTHKVNAKDCQDVIDPMRESIHPITFHGGEARSFSKGSCAGIIFNKMTASLDVHLSDVSSIMTERIFKPCVTQGMYRRWETNRLSVRLYAPSNVTALGKRGPDSQLSTREKHDLALHGTMCEDTGEVPVAGDCHRAIDSLSQHSSTGYIELPSMTCLWKLVDSCAGHVCNGHSKSIRINEVTLAWNMTSNIFNPCVVNGKYGFWEDDSVQTGLTETPPNPSGIQTLETSITEMVNMLRKAHH